MVTIGLAQCACQSACVLSALSLKSIRIDTLIGTDTALVRLAQGASPAEVMLHSPEAGSAGVGDRTLPIGHQYPSCPVVADDQLDEQPERQLRSASVAVAVSGERVLLTRRPASMRSFPRAWVMAGGAVDATDPTLAHAAVRELKEETGLEASPTDLTPFGLWESASLSPKQHGESDGSLARPPATFASRTSWCPCPMRMCRSCCSPKRSTVLAGSPSLSSLHCAIALEAATAREEA